MQKQIKNQIAALKLMACSTPFDNSKDQMEALKAYYAVKTLKELYHCLDNELTNGLFAALKKASIIIVIILCSLSGIAQQKRPTLELDTTTNKMYLVKPEGTKHELFRDLRDNGEMGKYYFFNPDSTKNYSTFRRTPETITFDRKY